MVATVYVHLCVCVVTCRCKMRNQIGFTVLFCLHFNSCIEPCVNLFWTCRHRTDCIHWRIVCWPRKDGPVNGRGRRRWLLVENLKVQDTAILLNQSCPRMSGHTNDFLWPHGAESQSGLIGPCLLCRHRLPTTGLSPQPHCLLPACRLGTCSLYCPLHFLARLPTGALPPPCYPAGHGPLPHCTVCPDWSCRLCGTPPSPPTADPAGRNSNPTTNPQNGRDQMSKYDDETFALPRRTCYLPVPKYKTFEKNTRMLRFIGRKGIRRISLSSSKQEMC